MVGPNIMWYLKRCENTKVVKNKEGGKEGRWGEDTEEGKGGIGPENEVVREEGNNTAVD